MKILKLRLKNLNSLAGEWSFDFRHPAYEQGGLLVITGPTGSGKTTILDAVCLALYGSTPRLNRIGEGANEIMTRGRAECSAELIFETPAGRYRCHWSQHRARRKADGRLQPPRHEIVDDVSGRVLESSPGKALIEVEKITGLNFERFSRSMLLAQGAFAFFLDAPAKDRAGLLEQITGTEIYGRLSTLVHERKALESGKLEALRQEIGNQARPEENESVLAAELAGLSAGLAELDRALAENGKALEWRKTLSDLESASAAMAGELQELERSRAEFQPQKARLDLALKAMTLAGEYGGLKERRRQKERAEADLTGRRRQLPAAEAAEVRAARAAAEAETGLAAARAAEEAARPGLIQARALDVELRSLAGRLIPMFDKLGRLMSKLRELSRGGWPVAEDDLSRAGGWPAELRAELESLGAGVESGRHRLAGLLAGRDLSGWRADFLAGSRRQDWLEKLIEELTRAEQWRSALSESGRAIERTAADLAAMSAELRLETERVAALERDGERLAAIWNLQREVRSLQERRAELADGRPCPLCGALEHPYARPENIPADQLGPAELQDHKVRLAAARRKVNGLTAGEAGLTQSLAGARESADKLKAESGRLYDSLKAKFIELGQGMIPDNPIGAARALKTENQKKLEAAELVVREAEKLEKEMAAAEARHQGGLKVLGEAERLIEEALQLRAELQHLRGQEAGLRRERFSALADRNPDEDEKRLASAVILAREALETKKAECRTAEKNREKLAALIAETEAELAGLVELNRTGSEGFAAGARAAGFADEAAWQAALMDERERAEIDSRFQSLSVSLAGLEARVKENRARLAEISALGLTRLTRPELEAEMERLAGDSRTLLTRKGAVDERLVGLRRASETYERLRLAAEAQRRECGRWDHLDRLIGSYDGNKYRNFAQGLTFEILIRQANSQLSALSDRYLLQSDRDRPLELSVMDNYQAGEIRSTKNLSGGESFLVSLALALGLAKMAGRRVRVDTLFLDEGFGSLDEDTLDQALEALTALRSEGKLIGVISHIRALTDRIPTQIVVRPQNGPFSRVSGPGVEAIPRP